MQYVETHRSQRHTNENVQRRQPKHGVSFCTILIRFFREDTVRDTGISEAYSAQRHEAEKDAVQVGRRSLEGAQNQSTYADVNHEHSETEN